jgi:hypothetical protein
VNERIDRALAEIPLQPVHRVRVCERSTVSFNRVVQAIGFRRRDAAHNILDSSNHFLDHGDAAVRVVRYSGTDHERDRRRFTTRQYRYE